LLFSQRRIRELSSILAEKKKDERRKELESEYRIKEKLFLMRGSGTGSGSGSGSGSGANSGSGCNTGSGSGRQSGSGNVLFAVEALAGPRRLARQVTMPAFLAATATATASPTATATATTTAKSGNGSGGKLESVRSVCDHILFFFFCMYALSPLFFFFFFFFTYEIFHCL
jgi:hypothetical protein